MCVPVLKCRQLQGWGLLKVSCYRNYCIDFNQIWHNDKDHQVVIVPVGDNKSKMAGGRHFEKSQKSRYLRNGSTDLYEIWYADAKWVS